jgi:SAM-dependent methyltransferase
MKASSFPWPQVDGKSPIWAGTGFRVGDSDTPVLVYDCGESGWSNSLTRMHEESAGEDHPIDRLSRGWALAAVRRHVRCDSPVLLEVGCSSGFLLRELQAQLPDATTIGSDFLKEPLDHLATVATDIPLMQFDLVRCPLPAACVDAVVLLNVLEHIDNDREAVRQVVRILKPGGIAIVEVPSGPHLYDVYDEYLKHYRRYSSASLAALMSKEGLEILQQSHLGCSVYPAFAMVKRRNQRNATDPAAKRRIVESRIRQTRASIVLKQLLRFETWLGRRCSFPFGIRCVAVGRKPFEPTT